MSGIRVTYSGLISFGVGMISIITGLIFTLIVTRQLTAEDLGLWTLVGGLLVYVLISEPIISYWVTREVARNIDSGKTAIIANGFFTTIAIGIYLILIQFLGQNESMEILYFGALLIPVNFFNKALTAITYGSRPQGVSYGILAIEITKIPAGFVFVYFLQMGVIGAILATTIGYIASNIVLCIYVRNELRGKFYASNLKKWIKLFWISLYPGLTNFIRKLDILLFTVITGSVVGLAYYAVSNSIGSIVMHSASISKGIYPKLLAHPQAIILQENLLRVFYFAIPLTGISLVFMKPGLFALNPIYEIAVPVGIFLTIRMFIGAIATSIYPALTAIEKIDLNENATWRDYVKSKLFFMPTINLIKTSIYIISLTIVLLITTNLVDQLTLVTYWAITTLIIEIPWITWLFIQVRKVFHIELDYHTIGKYILATCTVLVPVYFIMNNYLEYHISIFEFLPVLMTYVGISISAYLFITYLIDSKTKLLFTAIISEIKKDKSEDSNQDNTL